MSPEPADAKLFAYRSYRNAPEAISWLAGLGFETAARQDGDDGQVLHCEMRLGQVVVMLASYDADYEFPPLVGRSTGQGLYVLTDQVDELYQAALTGGGAA